MPSRRQWVLLGGIALLGGASAVVLAGPPAWLVDAMGGRDPGCLYRIITDEPVVALTLDDGPDSVTTPVVLDRLRRHGARATFFLITSRIDGREEIVHRLVAEGHELGNHFTRDRAGIRLGAEEFAADLRRAQRRLAPFGPVRWARPGSGWYTRRMVETMEREGFRCALGSIYPWDAAHPWPAFSAWHILRNVRPGAIVVLHDGSGRGGRTVEVLRRVLPELARRGYRVVTLSELAAACACAPEARAQE